MSKYFSKDSKLYDTYESTNDDSVDISKHTPSTDNLTQPLSNDQKEQLAIHPSRKAAPQKVTPPQPDNPVKYTRQLEQQIDQVTNMVNSYSKESKEEMVQQFKKFTPLELFEKINQVFFVVADLSNKIKNLETKIDTVLSIAVAGAQAEGIKVQQSNIDERKVITDPAELELAQKQIERGEIPTSFRNENIPPPRAIPPQAKKKSPNDLSVENTTTKKPSYEVDDRGDPHNLTTAQARKILSDINSGKGLPDEGFTDKSVNFEEMFPNLDDEAYQAAYASRALRDKHFGKNKSIKKNTPQPGEMKGITGF